MEFPAAIRRSRRHAFKANVRISVLIVVIAFGKLYTPSLAQNNSETIATVNETKITADQIERDIARSLGDRNLSSVLREKVRRETLEKFINQHVVLDFLKQRKLASSENEVRLAIEELKEELSKVEKSLDDYLEQTKQSREDLEFNIAWQRSWKRYLDQMLTDDLLEGHFQRHQRRFDGTELRVAHLLLGKSDSEKAKTVLQQLKSRDLTWAQAVREHSVAPTKNEGGEIGWIKLSGPMPTNFSQAAFQLSAGQVSPPVETRFGIHLIRCLEVKPGARGWRDAEQAVRKSATRELFDAVANKHRPSMTIRDTNPGDD